MRLIAGLVIIWLQSCVYSLAQAPMRQYSRFDRLPMTYAQLIQVLGFTPYNATNPAHYVSTFSETDPLYLAGITNYYTKMAADARYLQSYTELDPIWSSASINYYTKTQTDGRYLQSYSEGDPIWNSQKSGYYTKSQVDANTFTRTQSDGRYLQSFVETDPIWVAAQTNYYTKSQSDAKYLQSFTELDPGLINYYNKTVSDSRYLQSFTESDPLWIAQKTSYYTKTLSDARYLQSYTESDPIYTAGISNYYSKSASDARYLQSFTEADPVYTAGIINYYTKTLSDARYLQAITSGMISTALGFTPVTITRKLTIQGVQQDLSADRVWTIINGTGFVKASGTAISYDNSTYLTAEVDGSTTNEIELPTQTGNGGKLLKTNGTTVSWSNVLYDKGTVTTSGVALQTVYVITHGLSYTPSSIQLQARSQAASEKSWISAISATTFTVTFNTVPILGTNNIVLDWIAIP